MTTPSRSLSSTIAFCVLGAASLAQGAYTLKLRRDVRLLNRQLDSSGGGAAEGVARASLGLPVSVSGLRPGASSPAASAGESGSGRAGAPVALAPLPAAIASDEARDLLRSFVAGEIERLKDEKKAKKESKRVQAYDQFFDGVVNELGVPEPDERKVAQVLEQSQREHRELRLSERNGQKSAAEVTAAMAALRGSTQQELKQTLGDDWAKKLEEARKKLRETQRQQSAARGGGGVFWFMAKSG